MNNYDRIKYVGNAKDFRLSIYPSNKEVKLNRKQSYYFTKDDVLNEISINYYKSLRSSGIILCEKEDSNAQEVKEVIPEKKESVVKEEVVEKTPEVVIPDVVDPKIDESASEISAENNSEELNITNDEMIEYLDLTYSDDEISSVAKEAGVNRIRSNWDKATIISKIIETNSQFVIDLMKNQ